MTWSPLSTDATYLKEQSRLLGQRKSKKLLGIKIPLSFIQKKEKQGDPDFYKQALKISLGQKEIKTIIVHVEKETWDC
ncbi:hypothetical protein CEXT_208491 [Caerostris extrusa]|uniref:Uncharacterized protein n=1 Tax=Caerostris extrusa TaxID=172846 RepID=A0AAV4XN31_CAEEX|nr:hypothetical protein CEXT_208491 [Caerostris extrusa]